MFFGSLRDIFKHRPAPTAVQNEPLKIKTVIAAFEDDCPQNSGEILARHLSGNDVLETKYYDNPARGDFAKPDSRNFFDFYDAGQQILNMTGADVLIRGFRKQDKLCLNFQASRQYEKLNAPFFSLLNNLYLPLSYFQENNFPDSIKLLIFGVLVAIADVKGCKREEILTATAEGISRQPPPKGLEIFYMPYFLNTLAFVYLCAKAEALQRQDVKIISGLLATAEKYRLAAGDMLLTGSIYANLGQMYQKAAENLRHNKYVFYKNAADCYRYAQKCFNRHACPYDFGILSYRLSKVYYGYWKQSSDVQALRDAVFNLREAEKIFSKNSFPYFWASVQGDLGLYLSLLGLFSGNDEISMLAVENYKKRQQVYNRERWPLEWAKAEESIGNIFYNSGKKHDDEEYLEEAVKYYASAADIYENGRMDEDLKQMRICIAKADEYILQLARK